MSSNVGALTSWNPQGLSRPVMGLLYLTLSLLASNLFVSVTEDVTHYILKWPISVPAPGMVVVVVAVTKAGIQVLCDTCIIYHLLTYLLHGVESFLRS
jgi:hypothetical protein